MRKEITFTCPACNKQVTARKDTKNYKKNFCDSKCHNDYKYLTYIERWKEGKESGLRGSTALSNHINRYLRDKYGNKCCQCGWDQINPHTKRVPVEVDHIDGNYINNGEENLRLLCPNCHSLTESFRSLNKGRGRPRKS